MKLPQSAQKTAMRTDPGLGGWFRHVHRGMTFHLFCGACSLPECTTLVSISSFPVNLRGALGDLGSWLYLGLRRLQNGVSVQGGGFRPRMAVVLPLVVLVRYFHAAEILDSLRAARLRSAMSGQPGRAARTRLPVRAAGCVLPRSARGGSADFSGGRSVSGWRRMYSVCAARRQCRGCSVVASHSLRASMVWRTAPRKRGTARPSPGATQPCPRATARRSSFPACAQLRPGPQRQRRSRSASSAPGGPGAVRRRPTAAPMLSRPRRCCAGLSNWPSVMPVSSCPSAGPRAVNAACQCGRVFGELTGSGPMGSDGSS